MPEVKKLHIKCTDENSLTVLQQNKMIKNLHIENVKSIKSGHLPMLSLPNRNAEIRNEFANSLSNH